MSHFPSAVAYTLSKEGRLSNDRNDRGGLTKYGIIGPTLATYQRKTGLLAGRTVASLTQDEAVAIYRALYWRYDTIEDRTVAIKLFDYGVNVGLTQAVLFAQRALVTLGAEMKADGLWGPQTRDTLNRAVSIYGVPRVLKAMCYHAAKFYLGLVDANRSQIDFIDGWLARAASRP